MMRPQIIKRTIGFVSKRQASTSSSEAAQQAQAAAKKASEQAAQAAQKASEYGAVAAQKGMEGLKKAGDVATGLLATLSKAGGRTEKIAKKIECMLSWRIWLLWEKGYET